MKKEIQMESDVHVKNPLVLDDLYSAFRAADQIVLKKYLYKLSDASCLEMDKDLQSIKVGGNVSLYRVAQIVYDKNENIQDKLTTVYSSILSLGNYGIVMLVNGHKESVDLFLGVVTRNLEIRAEKNQLFANDKELGDSGKVLRDAFVGNFPGIKMRPVKKVSDGRQGIGLSDLMSKEEILKDSFQNAKCIAAVSSIPAMRNTSKYKNEEFVQGLEKLIDTMREKEYSMLIIADAMDNSKIEEMCANYEDLYSQLVPFKTSSQTLNVQKSSTDTNGIIKGVTNTTNESIAKSLSHGTSVSKTHTNSVGGGGNVGLKIVGAMASYAHANSKTDTKTTADINTKSSGTAKSLTEQNSVAKSLSTTNGESIQLNYENRAVKTLLERIDEQIKRMRTCEDFGMFDTCAYFAAKDYNVAVAAASAFKSLTRGDNSSVEASYVNVWKKEEDIKFMKEYLMRLYHPEFLSFVDENHSYRTTAAMLISGKEMACQMALPQKSVAGVPVVECAEFGQEVVSLSGCDSDEISIGNIYHMHEKRNNKVMLDVKSLTAHTFITGSTGSGKSTTIYKLLKELSEISIGDSDETVKFMVIEPAKGEYKNALANNEQFDLHVYGTNPKLTQLLRINPFKFPSDKIHIYEHLDRLIEIFNVCWPMYAAMPAVLKAAMENAYRAAGWNLVKSENKHGDIFPSFVDVAIEVEKYINKSEYSAENKSNYKGSLLTRLESLTNGINSMIFTTDDIDDKKLFDENVIVDLSRVGSNETKALLMGILVLKLQEYRIAHSDESDCDLRHVTVLEEAHNLLKRTSTEQSSESSNLLGKSVEMLANAIAEMRTYGEGFIIADQSPGLLDMSVIRNTNTKIIMRLPDSSDRELVGKAAGLNADQIVELSKLPCGVAAVYQNDWMGPVLCKIKRAELREQRFIEVADWAEQRKNDILLDLLDSEIGKKLDDLTLKEALKQSALKAELPAEKKVELLDFLSAERNTERIKLLASMVFDYFRNTKEILEKSVSEMSVDDVRMVLMAELEPSIIEYDDEKINLLIMLIMKEYVNRYYVDYPVWREFASYVGRGKIV